MPLISIPERANASNTSEIGGTKKNCDTPDPNHLSPCSKKKKRADLKLKNYKKWINNEMLSMGFGTDTASCIDSLAIRSNSPM
jgi:hypothetical protein